MKITIHLIRCAIVLVSINLLIACGNQETVPPTITDNNELSSIVVNNKPFHVETFGKPVNPTVIIIHGGPGWDYKYMLPLANLSDEYFVVFYDQSGCGLSPRYDAEELTIANAIEDLHGIVLHYNNNRRVNLIGHGYGAMLAAAYTGQYPDKVAYTVLAEPLSLTTTKPDSASLVSNPLVTAFVTDGKTLSEDHHEKYDIRYLKKLGDQKSFPATATCHPQSWSGNFISRPGALASEKLTKQFYSPEKGYFIDFTVGNDRFKNTMLLLFSECNPYFTAEKKTILKESLDRAIIKTVPGTGHLMFNDNPSSTVAFIRGYFDNTKMIRSNKTFLFN